MNLLRRSFIKFTATSLASLGALTTLAAAGLLKTTQAAAAVWNKSGFESKAVTEAIKSLGASNAADSRDIVITAPDIAENGAVVPVEITSNIAGTQSIAILVEKNPQPLAASFDVSNGGEPYVSVRLKVGASSNITAVVKAGGKSYTASREVKVTIGGCGG